MRRAHQQTAVLSVMLSEESELMIWIDPTY